jgi:LPXTG-motif cell wall-anchored protein
VTVVGGGGTVAVPSTQTFTPPQEIILRSSTPTTQVFTPPATRTVTRTVVVHTGTPTVVSQQTFTPPRTSNLPFTGSNVALGLIAGIALVCGGGFLLVRRRDELGEALEHQAAALDRLLDR